jgi:hypothetical protein
VRLAGYKRTKLAPGVTGDEGHYDTDLPWVCWWFLSTDRETRFTGRSRVLMQCAICGQRRKLRLRIPRFGPIPDRGEHPITQFKLDHLHRWSDPCPWCGPSTPKRGEPCSSECLAAVESAGHRSTKG